MALPQNPYLHNSRLHSHTLMRGNIFPLERRSGAAEVDSKEKRVTYLWQFRIGLLPLLLYVSIQRTSIFAHHQVCIKKIGTKNKANKSDKKANAWSGAKKRYYTKARKKFCSSWMQLACVCACVECIWLCMGCSSCCHFPAFVLNFLDDFRAAYFWAHNLWPPGIKLAKAQHEKATSGAY